MYTEELLRGIFRALTDDNDNKIDSMYNNDVASRYGFSNPNEKRDEFFVNKELRGFLTGERPKIINNFLETQFIQKTAGKEGVGRYFEIKQQGENWKDYVSTYDLLKYYTYQNDVIALVNSADNNLPEKKTVEELFLTLMPLVDVHEFFSIPTKFYKEPQKGTNIELNQFSFDEIQQAVAQGICNIHSSKEMCDNEVYSYSSDPNYVSVNFNYFPNEQTMRSLNFGSFSNDIWGASASFIVDKLRFNLDKSFDENLDGVVGEQNFNEATSDMVEN